MKIIKRLNNNAIMCLDSRGHQVIAFGKGIAFALPKGADEVPLSVIERTFYDVDEHYVSMLDSIKPSVLSLAADIADDARTALPYDMSPNLPLALADHISFALERQRRGITVTMPLAYDVGQLYPIELRLGEQALVQVTRELNVDLPESEAVGIALCFVNAMSSPEEDEDAAAAAIASENESLINDITEIIERGYDISVDRHGFEFARFATHLRYLLDRLRTGDSMPGPEAATSMYEDVRAHAERSGACLDQACALLSERLGCEIDDSEKLYLLLHIGRVGRSCHMDDENAQG